MTPQPKISLFAYLVSPRAGLTRLNGWQRIWLVLTGVILALHVLIGSLFFPNPSRMRFDPSLYEAQVASADKWKLENRQRCRAAAEEVQFADRFNAEYNDKGEAKARELMAATQVKLDEARARLFAIETSGGKFYGEWAKYDNAIEAYTMKLREQKWIPRSFKDDEMVKPESLSTVKECIFFDQQRTSILADMDTAKQTAEIAREDGRNVVFGTLISFPCISLGLYLIGWCVGWIKGGFRAVG
ncbi:hypothetical protein [Polaromonas glacialis]|uniref:hypothetical protein n=1 Tax=Polaromonas glacialis TaxID=866564 RepID=UPI001E5235C8|nr:hypothetical protein [Polaromonas glacialis]